MLLMVVNLFSNTICNLVYHGKYDMVTLSDNLSRTHILQPTYNHLPNHSLELLLNFLTTNTIYCLTNLYIITDVVNLVCCGSG